MNCLNIEDFITRSNDQLSESEQAKFDSHLVDCQRCLHLQEELGQIQTLLPAAWPSQPLGPTPHCPDEIDLVQFLEVGRERSTEIKDHVAGCVHCLEQIGAVLSAENQALSGVSEDLRDVVEKAKELVPERGADLVEEPTTTIFGWRWALASGALAVVLIVPLLVLLRNSPPPDPSQTVTSPPSSGTQENATANNKEGESVQLARNLETAQSGDAGGDPSTQVRSTSNGNMMPNILAPVEGAELPRADLVIQWVPLKDATQYEVTLLNDAGDVVWETRVEGLSASVPDSVSLIDGERYFVWVSALVDDRQPVRSPSVAFTIRRQDSR